ncbi:hypothetical protein BDQ94DRAFT_138625 [Aspergillus welwitschiae]|uniref:Uncharacterized protein n=1 Tax=Aspergillus welwitschiae TaxID=1341132 RepID=A0A3F3QAD7_9EURO|nr:hypothetical protein BDQ94DRAFT_138625 [Aspergillus welwitschiae]RDH36128.1 hypothetical protein BDQ94DRAFT_138625 [Aspergillus welwitschiae]
MKGNQLSCFLHTTPAVNGHDFLIIFSISVYSCSLTRFSLVVGCSIAYLSLRRGCKNANLHSDLQLILHTLDLNF